ncbi:hypothetical protein I4U23_019255 [Adineta vaga]|nr:hypothetical protein I4U23_019255 [Adineta vaga]
MSIILRNIWCNDAINNLNVDCLVEIGCQPQGPATLKSFAQSKFCSTKYVESSWDNTVLYIELAIGGFVLLLIICGIDVLIMIYIGYIKNSPSFPQTNNRTSITSA